MYLLRIFTTYIFAIHRLYFILIASLYTVFYFCDPSFPCKVYCPTMFLLPYHVFNYRTPIHINDKDIKDASTRTCIDDLTCSCDEAWKSILHVCIFHGIAQHQRQKYCMCCVAWQSLKNKIIRSTNLVQGKVSEELLARTKPEPWDEGKWR